MLINIIHFMTIIQNTLVVLWYPQEFKHHKARLTVLVMV